MASHARSFEHQLSTQATCQDHQVWRNCYALPEYDRDSLPSLSGESLQCLVSLISQIKHRDTARFGSRSCQDKLAFDGVGKLRTIFKLVLPHFCLWTARLGRHTKDLTATNQERRLPNSIPEHGRLLVDVRARQSANHDWIGHLTSFQY